MLGETISHYKISEKLGEGGMGVVYRAHDLKLDRPVAIKILPTHLVSDEETCKRFIQEARAASALDHPNICTIYEIDETPEGQTFIVMAYYKGKTLRERIDTEKLTSSEAVSITAQIASGLVKAHEKGIVHRDIKPRNILLTDDGDAKIIDFGLAKLIGHTKLTKDGSTVGTAAYMSPEQAKGEEIDHRSDIFSLGTILYEMLVGKRPFKGEHDAALLYAIVHEDIIPTDDESIQLPKGLLDIASKALKKNIKERYQTAEALSEDLKSHLGGTEGSSYSSPSRRTLSMRGMRLSLILSLSLVVPIVVAIYFIWVRSPEEPDSIQRIAVLPFMNIGATEDEYFADGLTEEIIARLAGSSDLSIIARTSILSYKNSEKSIKEIGRELSVDHILEGTVRWSRNEDGSSEVRITPQLIKVSDETHVWAAIYEEPLENIFDVQSSIALAILNQLDVATGGRGKAVLAQQPTENLEAYEYFLRGIDFYNRGIVRSDQEQAIEYLYKAVELDSTYVKAQAWLSMAYSSYYWQQYSNLEAEGIDTEPILEEARRKAEMALRLNPNLADSHLAYAAYVSIKGDAELSIQYVLNANELQPNNADILCSLGGKERRLGRWDKAIEHLEKAVELDPRSPKKLISLLNTLLLLRRFEDANDINGRLCKLLPDEKCVSQQGLIIKLHLGEETDEYVLELKKTLDSKIFPYPLYYFMYWDLAIFHIFHDQFEDRVENLTLDSFGSTRTRYYFLKAEYYDSKDDINLRDAYYDSLISYVSENEETVQWNHVLDMQLGIAYSQTGRREDALRIAERYVRDYSVSRDAMRRPGLLTVGAIIYSSLGEDELALDLIDTILSMPSFLTMVLLELDSNWDSLRDHPGYKEIISKYSDGDQ